jgi:bleomycin hydrolase
MIFRKLSPYMVVFILAVFVLPFKGVAQDEEKEKDKKPAYQFTVDVEVKRTPVKDQARTGTCWCFTTVSFLESEALRMGKDEVDLSEMYVVRYTYPHKARNFIRLHGNATFSQGGQCHDVIDQVRRYGIVPEEVYPGMKIGEKKHNHGEMSSMLRAIVDAVLKKRGGKLTPRWMEAFETVLDTYLGKPPEKFTYKGKTYTPGSFTKKVLGLNLDDYVEFTSYSHHPFYKKCMLELPDNWTYSNDYYNVSIDDLEKIADHALKSGYSIAWDGDVSERDFSSRTTGYGVVPLKDWDDKTKEESEKKVTEPVEEKEITQEMRQETFNNYTTTDDHLMHIVGLAHDQKGNKFYYTKNSGGTERKYDGYVYLSKAYFRLKTTAMMVHKNALPKDIRKKLKIK